MKKFKKYALCFTMVGAMMLGLAGCGADPTLETKTVKDLTMSVPSDYGDFEEKDGLSVAAGPNASITVSGPLETELQMEELSEEVIQAIYKNSYREVEFKSFDNAIQLDKGVAMNAHFIGTTVNDKKMDTRLIVINTDDGKTYTVFIMFKNGEDCSTSKFADDMMKSIKLK